MEGFNLMKQEAYFSEQRNFSTVSFFFLVGTFFLGLFSNSASFGVAVQMLSVLFLVIASVFAQGIRHFRFYKLNPVQVVLLLMCFVSFFSASFRVSVEGLDLSYSILYTTTFLIVVLFLGTLVRSYSVETLLRAAAHAYVLMIIVVLATNAETYFASLAMGADDRWKLRFMPFEMHPNLMGFVFGGGAIVLAHSVFFVKGIWRKIFYVFFGLISISFIFAASARASLVAIAFSCATVFFTRLPKLGAKTWFAVLSLVFAGSLILIANFDWLYDYVSEVLELESETRGVDSGATGRTELWLRGFNLVFSEPFLMFFGGSLRSASPELIGFSTESSYITIALETGLVLAAAWVYFVCILILRSAKKIFHGGAVVDVFVLTLLVFVLVQSFFNRYMIAIGNPLSVLYLVLVVSLGKSLNRQVVV